ncbi:hypothetical protein CLV31_103336 [Algoriphagus aquaeductus]|uniref:Uncharacterized protein n=1 Tax=Algoriphagus aquaeductus TaxID=475299 RepID=A0A326RVL1_9BACT|nr:hypothetical protein CLV31_103336 [Algoriphagus aquaeductus]
MNKTPKLGGTWGIFSGPKEPKKLNEEDKNSIKR